ncbi:MAG TPA: hypothetical protein VFQ61_20200, partial [Polyangiaceae bacterium]|nr:hypothetical protein [Polyangiaceae bacterium]
LSQVGCPMLEPISGVPVAWALFSGGPTSTYICQVLRGACVYFRRVPLQEPNLGPAGLVEKIQGRVPGILLYGIAPPKRDTLPTRLVEIAAQQRARLQQLQPDGLIVYDIQDESERTPEPRPFPFVRTLAPEQYAYETLAELGLPKIVYRQVTHGAPAEFRAFLERVRTRAEPSLSVLVGAPTRRTEQIQLRLSEAYALARESAFAEKLVLGGIAIAERHQARFDEHQKMLAKSEQGVRFFVTQAVYDVASSKSLLSDYAIELSQREQAPVPVLLTFSPCGSEKTLAFMKWLGISIPRWLENELRYSTDILEQSVELCVQIFQELWLFARKKGIPLGANVESVSIRKSEIDASVELFQRLRRIMRG